MAMKMFVTMIDGQYDDGEYENEVDKFRCRPAPQALARVLANLASSRSATLGSSTTPAPPLDKLLPGAPLPPPGLSALIFGVEWYRCLQKK